MAAGKSTLAMAIAAQEQACLFVEDRLLEALYPAEVASVQDYIRCSARIRQALGPQIVWLLREGISVVLDFPGNTRNQRAWFRLLIDEANCAHVLHFIDAPDALCKAQLGARSASLPPGSKFTSDAEFDAITAYFQAPTEDEEFEVRRHVRNGSGDEVQR